MSHVIVETTKGQIVGPRRGDQVTVMVPASAVKPDDEAIAAAATVAKAKADAIAAMPEETITIPAGADPRLRADVERLKSQIARSQLKADRPGPSGPAVRVR